VSPLNLTALGLNTVLNFALNARIKSSRGLKFCLQGKSL
jgi:hypothetical protein